MIDTAKLPPPNPHAFPHTEFNDSGTFHQVHTGMTLRDHFAGQAMPQTILLMLESVPSCTPTDDGGFARAVARLSYQMADAMLAERVAVQS